MSYTVVWGPIAESMLARIWLDASDRNAVAAADAALDAALRSIPLKIGASRESSIRRIAVHSPLAIAYEVVEDDKKVIVQGVFAVS